MIFTNCNLILENAIVRGSLCTEGDRIRWISGDPVPEDAGCEEVIDLGGRFLAPGFVDEHCHGSGEYWHFENPSAAAVWHLKEGTTSLLCSMWRNAGDYSFRKAIENVKAAMGEDSNIRGIHMEGPYLDPDYGSEGGRDWPFDPEEYRELMEAGRGIIRQWTFDPAKEGALAFAREAQKEGIRLAVCYSKAKPELLETFEPYGLTIGTHMLCGSGHAQPMFRGTYEPGSDQFVLVNDRMYAEVIADSLGGHVRPYYLKLIYKCKGADRICLVSDCCAGGDTCGSDVNVINGELYGSRLTLSVAIRNMQKHTGAPLIELIRMASATPAKAMGLYGDRGSIASGKIADLVVLDPDLSVKGVLLGGKWVRRDMQVTEH